MLMPKKLSFAPVRLSVSFAPWQHQTGTKLFSQYMAARLLECQWQSSHTSQKNFLIFA
jgi:hypothetical protein